jgi:hypothetical protein
MAWIATGDAEVATEECFAVRAVSVIVAVVEDN